MDCERVHELLEAWLDGSLEPELRASVEAHLSQCPECSAVASWSEPGALPDHLVLHPVLSATTGRSCSRVQEILAGAPDADPGDRERAFAHRDHCAACDDIARVLDELPRLLPTLASADPGPNFTADVLMATLPRPSLWSVFRTRVRDCAERWSKRQGFAQELSFALTVLLVLLTVAPGSPLGDAPRQALSVVQLAGSGPAELPSAAGPDEGTVGDRLRHGLRARSERLGPGFDRLGAHVLGAGRGLVEGDLELVEENAARIGCDLRRLWRGVREPAIDPESLCS